MWLARVSASDVTTSPHPATTPSFQTQPAAGSSQRETLTPWPYRPPPPALKPEMKPGLPRSLPGGFIFELGDRRSYFVSRIHLLKAVHESLRRMLKIQNNEIVKFQIMK